MGDYRYVFGFIVFGPPIIIFAVAFALDLLLSWRLAIVWLVLCGALLLCAGLAWWPFELTSESASRGSVRPVSPVYVAILGIGYGVAVYGWFRVSRLHSS